MILGLFTKRQTKPLAEAYLSTKESLQDTNDKFAEIGDIITRTFNDKLVVDEKFRIYSQATREAIIFLSKDGIIIDYNKSAAEMVGFEYDESNLIGIGSISILDTVPSKEDREAILHNIRVDSREVYDYEIKSPGNGKLITVRTKGFNIEYHGELVRVSSMEDVTYLRNVERENESIKKKIGMLLVRHGYTNETSVEEALSLQGKMPRLLEEILLHMKLISPRKLDIALQKQKDTQIGRILLDMEAITQDQLDKALMEQGI